MTSRGHTGRVPASRRPLSPQKFPTPRGPGGSGLPRPGGTVGRARSHSLPSSPLPGTKISQYRSPQGRRFPAHSSPPGAGTEAIIGVTGCPRSTASGRSSGTGARTPSRSRGRTEGAHQLAGPLCATRFPDRLRGTPTARLQPRARRKVRKPGWAQQTRGPSPQARGKAEFRPGA